MISGISVRLRMGMVGVRRDEMEWGAGERMLGGRPCPCDPCYHWLRVRAGLEDLEPRGSLVGGHSLRG